jgi:hypothetical protein
LLYFASAAAASLCGGLVHGFFLDANSAGHSVLWPATLLAIGANSVATWAIGAWLLWSPAVAKSIAVAACVGFAVQAAVVLSGEDSFRVAVSTAVPATLFLLIALLSAHRRERRAGALIAAAGLALTLLAMLVQQFGIGLHPRYFNHNAVAHVVQAVALALFFAGSLRLVGRSGLGSAE